MGTRHGVRQALNAPGDRLSRRSETMTGIPVHPGLEALGDGLYLIDAGWRVVYWNAAAERLYGVPRERALGRPAWDAVSGADQAGLRERLSPVMEGGAERVYTEPHPAGGGRTLVARATATRDGGVAVQLRDAEEEPWVPARDARLLESLRDGFLAVDPEWRVLYLNTAARELLSLGRLRPEGQDLLGMLPREPAELEAALRATMRDGSPRTLQNVEPEGKLFRGRRFDLRVSPLPGGGLSVMFEDITQRLQRERELARLAAEAEEATRAKSRFFAAVSHELRTPLNAIVGYTHLLGSDTYGPVSPGAARAAERAGMCAEHLAALVDDLLLLTTAEISRLPVSPRPVPLGVAVAGMLEPLRRQAEAKGLSFVLDASADGEPVETDPDRLRQLLQALVSNAIKFTSRGAVTVTVRVTEARERPAVLTRRGQPTDPVPAVQVEVADTGPGIPPDDRARIFDPFEQLGDPARHDSAARGTGLGLTIARQLTRLLCGTIEVDDAPGGGALFRVRIPRAFGTPVE